MPRAVRGPPGPPPAGAAERGGRAAESGFGAGRCSIPAAPGPGGSREGPGGSAAAAGRRAPGGRGISEVKWASAEFIRGGVPRGFAWRCPVGRHGDAPGASRVTFGRRAKMSPFSKVCRKTRSWIPAKGCVRARSHSGVSDHSRYSRSVCASQASAASSVSLRTSRSIWLFNL